MTIPIAKPYFTDDEKRAVVEVLESGWVVQGPKVTEFEEKVAEYVGARYAVATSSCTTALHLSLLALGVGPGDEAIVPAFTFVATANAVEYVGARPVFVDIDPKTFNIDVDEIEGKITSRTKAILPVHLFGLSAEMDAIMDVAERHNLKVVEDSACALGTRYRGKHAGTFGEAGCFSFHPRKAITTGEGGMIVTGDPALAERLRSLRDHGAGASDLARHRQGIPELPEYNVLGYNYRMTDIQGAVGVEQMRKLDWILERRMEGAEYYNEALKDLEGIRTPFVPEFCSHSYQSYVVLVEEGLSRDGLASELKRKGISTRQGTHSVPHLGYYRRKYGYGDGDFPRSLEAEGRSLALPLFAGMTQGEREAVVRGMLIAMGAGG
ncbi:MAG: DegT/DnrJ/EryC1/StrS family aminotransferase [bacterium]